MSIEGFSLGVSWIDRPQTLGEFVDTSVSYIEQLQALHPIFEGTRFLHAGEKGRPEQIAPDLSNVQSFVSRYGWNDKGDDEPHTGLQPDRTMSREGTSRLGFSCGFSCGSASVEPSDAYVSIFGAAAGARTPCVVRINFPTEGSPEFGRLDFVKKLMDVTVRCFVPEFGYVSSAALHKAHKGQDQLMALAHHESIGWLNYFSNPAVRRDLPPDVECEAFGPGGVLLTLQHDRPSAEDANAVARAVAIRQALLPGRWFDYEVERSTKSAPPPTA
jgi:hypothetical protein